MDVLILDDDVPVSELMETLISGLYSRAVIRSFRSVAEARTSIEQHQPDLMVCDWELPDGRGLEAVRYLRTFNSKTPVLMLSTSVDREKVLAAARYHVQGFVAKPFSANVMQQRLQALLPPPAKSGPDVSFERMLRQASETQVYLPVDMDPASVMVLIEQSETLSVAELVGEWQSRAALTARLLDVANSSAFRRSGEPCNSLREAVSLLGLRMSLNYALALSVDIAHRLSDGRLRELAMEHNRLSGQLADVARNLALKVGGDAIQCYTAGLLHRVGELAVISTAQQFINTDGALDDDEIDLAIAQWSGPLGNVLKVAWRLPLPLRNLIGACYLLPRGTTDRDRVLMRAAWMMANGAGRSEECRRLLSRMGLDVENAEAIAGSAGLAPA